MRARAKMLTAPEISLHFEDLPIESSNNLHHCQPKHGLISFTDMFTCSLALDRMFPCPLDCSSLLVLLHSRFIHPNLLPIQPKSNQIEQIGLTESTFLFLFWDLPALRSSLTYGQTPVCFWMGGCKCCLPPSAETFTDLPQIGYILAILHTSALPPTPRPYPETEL